MKRFCSLVFLFLKVTTAMSQTSCPRSTPVDRIAVYVELPNNAKPEKYQTLIFNNDTVDLRLDETDKCYYIELPEVQHVKEKELKPPAIRNYTIDLSKTSHFGIYKKDGKCQAEFLFNYSISYVLNILSEPRQPLNVNDSDYTTPPVTILSLNAYGVCIIKTKYGNWNYYKEYRVSEYLPKLDEVIIEYVKDIKECIKNNPNEHVSPEARSYIDQLNMGSPKIKYTLSICTKC